MAILNLLKKCYTSGKLIKMTDKLKGFLERHNYKITLTIIKFLKILGKNHCEEAITEI